MNNIKYSKIDYKTLNSNGHGKSECWHSNQMVGKDVKKNLTKLPRKLIYIRSTCVCIGKSKTFVSNNCYFYACGFYTYTNVLIKICTFTLTNTHHNLLLFCVSYASDERKEKAIFFCWTVLHTLLLFFF